MYPFLSLQFQAILFFPFFFSILVRNSSSCIQNANKNSVYIMTESKEVIHDIVFVFTARTAISSTWPLSCGIYLSSVLLNIMMICMNLHRVQLSNQEWNESVGQRLSSAQLRCLRHSRQAYWALWNKIKPFLIALFNLQAKLKATDDEPWLLLFL